MDSDEAEAWAEEEDKRQREDEKKRKRDASPPPKSKKSKSGGSSSKKVRLMDICFSLARRSLCSIIILRSLFHGLQSHQCPYHNRAQCMSIGTLEGIDTISYADLQGR